jgi:hypothetical protein
MKTDIDRELQNIILTAKSWVERKLHSFYKNIARLKVKKGNIARGPFM